MSIQTKFVRNYLSKPHFLREMDSIVVLSFCLLASWLYWNPSFNVSEYLAADYLSVNDKKEYWRLFTTSFVHADLKHLLSNSLMLSVLIYFVSSFYGSLVSIVLSFFVATLTNYFVLDIYGGETILVGASGVVFYLWGFWMILYMFLQTHFSLIKRTLRMGTVFLVLLVPTEYQPRTSYLAHYIGFAFGVLVGGFYYLLNRSKLLKAEVWSVKEVSDELTEFDVMALNYPDDVES